MATEVVTEVAGLRIVLQLDSTTVVRQMLIRAYFSIENIETTAITLSDMRFGRPQVQWQDSNFGFLYPHILRRSRMTGAPVGVQRTLAPGEVIEKHPLLMVQGWGARVALQVEKSEYGTGEIVGDAIPLTMQEGAPPAFRVQVGRKTFAQFERPEFAEGSMYYQEQHRWVDSRGMSGGATADWMEARGTTVVLHRPADANHLWEWECVAGWVNHPVVAFLHSCRW